VNELAFTLALPAAGITGWIARAVWTRHAEARADARLRRLLDSRVATFRIGYARLGGGGR
jgi:hypothetical protein